MWLKLMTNKNRSVLVDTDKILYIENRNGGTYIAFTQTIPNSKGSTVLKSITVEEDFEAIARKLGAK